MSNTHSGALSRPMQWRPKARRLAFDSQQDKDVLSVHHCVQNASAAHSACCPMVTLVIYLVIQRPGPYTAHHHTAARKTTREPVPPLPHTSSWRGASLRTGITLHSTAVAPNVQKHSGTTDCYLPTPGFRRMDLQMLCLASIRMSCR